jgi:hypothetical protein
MRRTSPLRAALARVRRAALVPVPVLGLLAAVGPLALSAGSVASLDPAEAAYRALPELPAGSSDHTAAGVEATAIALAASLDAVPVNAVGGLCDAGDLRVSWDDPGDRYEIGAHVTPVGPEPDETTTAVNGIVVCLGSTYAYMGFEATWAGARWDVTDVPSAGAEEDEGALVAQPAPVVPAGPHPVPTLSAPGTLTGPIEGYAAYEPQRTCDPTAKPGTRALAGALLRDYAGSRNLGIVRGCSVGGRSEHKEGRAFDWGVNITSPNEKAAAESFIASLLATDAEGNRHALARRMGVMYIIWNRQIWSSYRASEGWRPYSGSSAHRDHVHISLSWAGAQGRTSFWSGTVPPDLPTASLASANVSARSGARRTSGWSAPARTSGGDGGGRHDGHHSSSTHLSRDELAAGVRALWHDGVAPSAAEIEAWLVSVGVSQEWAHQYADWAAERAEHHASPPTTDAPVADAPSHDDGHDDWEAERQRRHDEWAAEQEREREERAAEEARRQAERDASDDEQDEPDPQPEQPEQPEQPVQQPPSDGGDHHGGWGGGGHHGGWGNGGGGGGQWGHQAPTTTAPPATTTTTVAPTTTTTVAPTTTTTAAPTTSTTAGG